MIPEPSQTLIDIATRIATHLIPETQSKFAQADAGLIAGLLLAMGQDFERAIANRLTDIDEVKAIIKKCPEHAPGYENYVDFLKEQPASYHLNDVNTLHNLAFEHLIELHAWTETNHLESLNVDIWQLLRRHSERNKFELPGI